MRKVLPAVFLLMANAILVFADLSDNVTVTIRENSTAVEIKNYNDISVTVSITIEYTEDNFNKFEDLTVLLGRKGFSKDSHLWKLRGIQIVGVDIKSVRYGTAD